MTRLLLPVMMIMPSPMISDLSANPFTSLRPKDTEREKIGATTYWGNQNNKHRVPYESVLNVQNRIFFEFALRRAINILECWNYQPYLQIYHHLSRSRRTKQKHAQHRAFDDVRPTSTISDGLALFPPFLQEL
ncbi:hypothetical protein BJX70DRAFT_403383 [Aspergillus crustosus]